MDNPLRFAGQYEDAETGLHYNWHRYYDPDLGRNISVDPLGFSAGDENFYAYVWNDPANFIDPRGLLVDVFIDIGFIVYDIYKLFSDPCHFGDNLVALGLDVVGAVI